MDTRLGPADAENSVSEEPASPPTTDEAVLAVAVHRAGGPQIEPAGPRLRSAIWKFFKKAAVAVFTTAVGIAVKALWRYVREHTSI
jgi:hypothetical protein